MNEELWQHAQEFFTNFLQFCAGWKTKMWDELCLWFMHGLISLLLICSFEPDLLQRQGKVSIIKRKHPESNSKSSFHDWIIYEFSSVFCSLFSLRWCMVKQRKKDEFKNFMAKALWCDKIGSDRRIFNSIFVPFMTFSSVGRKWANTLNVSRVFDIVYFLLELFM